MISEINKTPLISVLMPIYKGEAHLREAMDSILNQSFDDFEFVIVNDASPDQSEAIILSYDDSRIVYKKHEQNKGLVGALNSGLEICRGKYIARMDQDDIATPNRLELQYNFMENNPDYILLGGQADVIDSKQKLQTPITDEAIRAQLVFNTAFVHPTVMFRKSMLADNNLRYSENYKHAEDYGFWVELSAHGKMANLPQTCLYYRRHEGQYTVVFNQGMVQMVKKIRSEYLKKNRVTLTGEDLEILEIITERRIDYTDRNQVKLIGAFLSRVSSQFKSSLISQNEVRELVYSIWNKICNNRMKAGFPSYMTYISCPVAFYKFNLRTHLFFLKNRL